MRNWTCPTGKQWERYVVEKDFKGRSELEQHLAACPYCRFVVGQLTGELEAVTKVWKTLTVPQTYHYILSPLTPPDAENGSYLLAAQGNEKSEEPEAIALTTPDNKFLLRAVRDSHSGETWLYLVAEEQGTERNVLIRPFGGTSEYITDDQGRANLGKIDWPGQEALTAEIRLPRATFVLSPPADIANIGQAAELTSPAGDTIRLTFSGEGRNRRLDIDIVSLADRAPDSPLRIALRGPEMVGIMPLAMKAEPRASFDQIRTEGKLEIYLYQ